MRTFLSGLFARLGSPGDGDPSDDQLLAAFVASREEAAFQQIVRRHGAMVHGVCRRVLRNEADADDAFQAVFLVFIRKAASVRPGNLLGNWLYGVAVNVARKGRELNARRRAHELAAPQANPGRESGGDSDLTEVIDQELNRLPATYRAAVVACDLEGRTRREAAAQLGWSEGTVASRLARARGILADRLSRRGIVVPAAGLAAALGIHTTASAVVPRAVFTGHSEFVDTLAKETVKAMTANKVKTTALTLLAVAGLAGAGAGVVVACGGYGSRPTPPPVSAAKPPPDRSVETITGENIVAGWSKPGTWDGDGAAKPGGANGGESKPARFLLKNPERDITIVTDRDETFVEFFRRQRVMVATLSPKDFAAAYSLKKLSEPMFVGDSSRNQDGAMSAAYGAYVRLAPIEFDVGIAIPPTSGAVHLVLQADPTVKDAWHVVGFTTRAPAAFFTAKEKKGRDDFAPTELQFNPKK